MRMFIAFALSFVSSPPNEKILFMQNTKPLVHEKFVKRRRRRRRWKKGEKEFHTNSKRRRTFKNLFFIKPKRINLFTPFLRVFSLLPCSYTGCSCTGNFCGARSRISVFIISPPEPTGAWRKVQGSNASAEQKIYNSNSRYSRNKKFTFIMQIDIKCCAVERNPLLYIFSPKLSWGEFGEGSKGIYLQLRAC